MMKMDNTIIIMGGGGHARSVADVLLYNNPKQNIWFVDPCAKLEEKTFDFSVLKEFPTNMIDYKLNCHIGPEAVIGRNAIINIMAIVEHEVKIGDHSHIAPETIVSGRSQIGNQVFKRLGERLACN